MQHVLEALSGYILLAKKLSENKNLHGEVFNFGPNIKSNYKVIDILNKMKRFWKNASWKIKKRKLFYESSLLKLNSNKARKILKWKNVLTIDRTIKMTIEWYLNFYNKKPMKEFSIYQINYFQKLIKNKY